MVIRRHLGPVLTLLVLAGCATFSLPPIGSVIPGPEADAYPDAGAVILEDEATLEYRVMPPPSGGKPQLVAVLDHRRKLKILTEAGKPEADVRLPVDGFSTVTRVVGRSVAPGQTLVNLNSDAVVVQDREEVTARADAVKDLTLHISGAQVGGVIEYRYERIFLDPLYVPPWIYGAHLPCLRAELGVISDPRVEVDLRHGRGDAGVDRRPVRRDVLEDGRTRLVFVETDLAGMFAEPHGVHPAHRAPWTAVMLRQSRLGDGVRRYDSWDSVAAHVQQQMHLADEPHPGVHGDLLARVAALRAQIWPLAIEGLGVQRPDQSRAAKANQPICYREAAARALKSFADLAIDVPYLLLTGPQMPPFAEDFPAGYPFGRIALELPAQAAWLRGLRCDGPAYARDLLCGVKVGDLILFDPGCPACPLGTLTPGFADSRALKVAKDGSTRWVDLHLGGPASHSLVQDINLAMDVDGSLSGPIHVQARGNVAGVWRGRLRRAAEVTDAKHERLKEMGRVNAQMLLGDDVSPRADGIVLVDPALVDRPLGARAQVLGQARKGGYETFSFTALDLAGASIPAFWRGARQGAVVLGGPSWLETTVEVALPVGYVAQLPPQKTLTGAVADYAAGFSQRGRTLYFSRRLVLKQAALAADDWADFHDFFGQVRAYEAAAVQLQAQK